jgi:hypothetical protein
MESRDVQRCRMSPLEAPLAAIVPGVDVLGINARVSNGAWTWCWNRRPLNPTVLALPQSFSIQEKSCGCSLSAIQRPALPRHRCERHEQSVSLVQSGCRLSRSRSGGSTQGLGGETRTRVNFSARHSGRAPLSERFDRQREHVADAALCLDHARRARIDLQFAPQPQDLVIGAHRLPLRGVTINDNDVAAIREHELISQV